METGWLECPDPQVLLYSLGKPVSGRKSRMIATACCRRALHLAPDERCHHAVEVAERYADGLVGKPERSAARQAARAAGVDYAGARSQTGDAPWLIARAIRQTLNCRGYSLDAILRCLADGIAPCDVPVCADEQARHSDVIRHILGNPFRPYPAPASWPPLVVDLAQQLYDGADVRLVLHDALLDAGHAELAEHFRAEEWHPKGCWATDVILGRQ